MLQGKAAVHAASKINLIDSYLLGISIDIFKVQILLDADSSFISRIFVDEESRFLKLDFIGPQEFSLAIKKLTLPEAYINGELAAIDLGGFRTETIEITELISKSDLAVNYETHIENEFCSSIFKFRDLRISLFNPLDLDPVR